MFTEAELISIRRHCGYPAFGNRPNTYLLLEAYLHYSWLERRLNDLTDAEAGVLRTTYLERLDKLETDIYAAADNLDTGEAAVWKRNKREIGERKSLYGSMRRRLCDFLGVRPGPELQSGSGGNSVRVIV